MSTPQDPRGEPQNGPPYDPHGQPGSYRAGQQPGQYSSSPLSGQPYQPYGNQAGYNPYAGAHAAGLDTTEDPPARRPGLMVLGLVLMVLAALPFLVGGVVGLAGLDAESISTQLLSNPQFAAAGATPELVASLIQVTSAILLVVSLLYLLLAFLAFRGRNWARIAVSVLTVGFALLLLAGLVGGAGAGGVLGFAVFVILAAVGGAVILYLPDSRRFFSRPRR